MLREIWHSQHRLFFNRIHNCVSQMTLFSVQKEDQSCQSCSRVGFWAFIDVLILYQVLLVKAFTRSIKIVRFGAWNFLHCGTTNF